MSETLCSKCRKTLESWETTPNGFLTCSFLNSLGPDRRRMWGEVAFEFPYLCDFCLGRLAPSTRGAAGGEHIIAFGGNLATGEEAVRDRRAERYNFLMRKLS